MLKGHKTQFLHRKLQEWPKRTSPMCPKAPSFNSRALTAVTSWFLAQNRALRILGADLWLTGPVKSIFSTWALLLQHYPNVPCLIHPVPPPVGGAEGRKKSGMILGPYWHPPPPKNAPHAPAMTSKPSWAPFGAMFTCVYYSRPSQLASGSNPAAPTKLLVAYGKFPKW